MHASFTARPGQPPTPITVIVEHVRAIETEPAPLGPVIVHADALSPRFSARRTTQQQVLLEEMLNEKLSPELVTREGRPIAITVPLGCDSVDLFYGAIEITPGVGAPCDLDEIVAVGEAEITVSDGADDALDALTPGTTLFVTVPWKAAPWVDLPPNRLRVPVIAAFTRRGA